MNITNSSTTLAPTLAVSNCSANQKSPDGELTVGVKISVLCFVLVTALIGNTILILVIMKTKSLRRTMNYFLVNRGVGDIILPAIYVPFEIANIATGTNEWRIDGTFGEALCKLRPFLVDTAAVVSILSMVFMTVDRFCGVVLPMKRDLITGKIRSATIALIWFLGVLYTGPYFYIAKIFKDGDKRVCITSWEPAFDHVDSVTVHVVFQITVFGVLPSVLVCVLYLVMVLCVKRSKSASGGNSNRSSQERRPSRRAQMDLRVLRLALTIVAVLALCYIPHSTMLMIIALVWKWVVPCPKPPHWNNLYTTAQYLVLANTAINPVICFSFGANFRKGLKELISASPKMRLLLILQKSAHSNSANLASEERERLALRDFDSSQRN